MLSFTKYFISCSGYRKRTRTCEKKHPGTSICPGSYTDISLCDTASCSGYKLGQFILNINQHFIMKILIAASDYASDQCQAFIKADKRLESKISPLGKQNQHDTERLNLYSEYFSYKVHYEGLMQPVQYPVEARIIKGNGNILLCY